MPKVTKKSVHIKEYIRLINHFAKKARTGEKKTDAVDDKINKVIESLGNVKDDIEEIGNWFESMRADANNRYHSKVKVTKTETKTQLNSQFGSTPQMRAKVQGHLKNTQSTESRLVGDVPTTFGPGHRVMNGDNPSGDRPLSYYIKQANKLAKKHRSG